VIREISLAYIAAVILAGFITAAEPPYRVVMIAWAFVAMIGVFGVCQMFGVKVRS
jgi:hypothetical protein